MPPSLFVWKLALPETTATSGVPNGLIMSTPWWVRPPGRGSPNECPNARGPPTGQTQSPPVITAAGRGASVVAVDLSVSSPSADADPPLAGVAAAGATSVGPNALEALPPSGDPPP